MEHKLELTTTVTVRLSGFGRHLLDQHYKSPERDAFEAAIDEQHGSLSGSMQGPPFVYMPLWEAMSMFGPHIKGSNAWPVSYIEIALPEDPAIDELRGDVSRESKDARRRLRLLTELGKAIGLGNFEYCAPEEIERRVENYIGQEVSRIPDSIGLWHYGDKAMNVGLFEDHLVVKLRNGRLKRVVDFDPDPWCGPVRIDHRIPKFGAAADDGQDEDIPF